MTSELTTFKEAKARGLKSYFTGEPCKHGHVDIRYVSNRRCKTCLALATKAWVEANHVEYLQRKRVNRIKNDTPEKRAAAVIRTRNWYQSNKDRYNSWRQNWQSAKEAEDPGFKVTRRLRNRIYFAVAKKYGSTMSLVGCSKNDLILHIESQFSPGMTWDNYGEWHIDHIRPCASFDLTDPEQQKKCFHYTNLQPLWASDNLSKGCSYDQ